MVQIGDTLREARLRLGLSLAAAQKATKIRARYLEALEQDRLDLLPGAVYGRGFLHSYATLLELDPEPLLDELKRLLAELEPPPPPPPPVHHLPVPGRMLAIAGAVVTVLAGLALLGLDKGGRTLPAPAPLQRAVPQSPARQPPPAAIATSHAKAPALVLAATRGDCWLSVRLDSSAGAIVWQGLLRQGSLLRFQRLPLWIRMGAPWNLKAKLGQTPASLPSGSGPANVLLTANGARPA